MHSSAPGAAALMVWRSFSSALRWSALKAERYASMVRGLPAMAFGQRRPPREPPRNPEGERGHAPEHERGCHHPDRQVGQGVEPLLSGVTGPLYSGAAKMFGKPAIESTIPATAITCRIVT